MLFHETSDFPRELILTGQYNFSSEELTKLEVNSVSTIMATGNRQHLGVFGCAPIGFLSSQAIIWVVLANPVVSSPALLKAARKYFIRWADRQPWELIAEVWNDNKSAKRFALFMGFRPVKVTETLTQYKYKGIH